MEQLVPGLSVVRLFATDFDGIHTDGRVTVTRGETVIEGRTFVVRSESVTANRRDGLGYDMLERAGIYACIISKEAHPVVVDRAAKLRIPCHQAVATGEGKRSILERVARGLRLSMGNVLYMGDDLNDAEALAWAGIPACPADAHPRIRELVAKRGGIVTAANGGEGCVREAIEMILEAKGLPFAL